MGSDAIQIQWPPEATQEEMRWGMFSSAFFHPRMVFEHSIFATTVSTIIFAVIKIRRQILETRPLQQWNKLKPALRLYASLFAVSYFLNGLRWMVELNWDIGMTWRIGTPLWEWGRFWRLLGAAYFGQGFLFRNLIFAAVLSTIAFGVIILIDRTTSNPDTRSS